MFNPTAHPKTLNPNTASMAFAATAAVTDSLPRRNNFLSWTPRLARAAAGLNVSPHKSRRGSQLTVNQEQAKCHSDGEQDLNAVFDAMMFLPKDQRRILTMVCIHGMRYAEVADKLNLPLESVRSRLSDARNALEQFLDKELCNNPSPHHRQRS